MMLEVFLKKVNSRPAKCRPFFACFTATMSLPDLNDTQLLTGVQFPECHQFWATEKNFDRCHTAICYNVGSDYTKWLDVVVRNLLIDGECSFVFANSRSLTHNLAAALEKKLDEEKLFLCDIVHIHGKLTKEEKFILINVFCKKRG